MDKKRYNELMTNLELKLTEEEIKEGWHFCCEWDGLLIHPNDPEYECCSCLDKK